MGNASTIVMDRDGAAGPSPWPTPVRRTDYQKLLILRMPQSQPAPLACPACRWRANPF